MQKLDKKKKKKVMPPPQMTMETLGKQCICLATALQARQKLAFNKETEFTTTGCVRSCQQKANIADPSGLGLQCLPRYFCLYLMLATSCSKIQIMKSHLSLKGKFITLCVCVCVCFF